MYDTFLHRKYILTVQNNLPLKTESLEEIIIIKKCKDQLKKNSSIKTLPMYVHFKSSYLELNIL